VKNQHRLATKTDNRKKELNMARNKKLLKLIQRYIVNVSIAGSTLRNQGAKGVTEAAREFLYELDLSKFRNTASVRYLRLLDRWTGDLRQALPRGARNWGTARKALNVFMIQAFLNRYLAKEYGIQKFAAVLETPLDSYATKTLRKFMGRGKLPSWPGIKSLTPGCSADYQMAASRFAKEKQIPRGLLDVVIWRSDETD